MSLCEHEILEPENIFEKYIRENNNPSDVYAFSPKILGKFNKVYEHIDEYPTNTLIHIGSDGFYCNVNFYKATCGITYIFVTDEKSIREYFLLR